MQILYIDQWLMVVNKPAGLLSIQDGYNLEAPYIRTELEPDYGRCWIVHRLDKETSGVFLLARTKETHRSLSLLFEKRLITKVYRAIVFGIPQDSKFDVDLPLRINADRRHRTKVDGIRGKPAFTSFEVLKSSRDVSLVSAIPHTGYTHQIRSHLAYLHFPIAGDTLYMGLYPNETFPEILKTTKLALHAYSLDFEHPVTQENLHIFVDPPDFFSKLME